MKNNKGKDSDGAGIFGGSSRASARIEPRIGAEYSTRGRQDRTAGKMRSAASVLNGESRIVRDVLLDNVGSHYSPVDRPAKRERGYNNAVPTSKNNGTSWRKLPYWNLRWFSRRLRIAMFLMLVAGAGYWVSEPLNKLIERPIKSVVVEGEFNFITKTRATELLGNEIDGDFIQLDLMRLKKALLDDPWVESVKLNRRWPDTLVVRIVEQKPIARWGDGFLNQRGEIVRVGEATKLSGLPWLQGSEAHAIEILQQYQDLSQLLRSRGLEVIALKCDNKKSWRLTIKNGVEIAIGRDQVMEKMRRFVTVYDTQLNSVWSDVKTVDVRYTNGIAVRWLPDSEMAKKYLKLQTKPAHTPKTSFALPVIN